MTAGGVAVLMTLLMSPERFSVVYTPTVLVSTGLTAALAWWAGPILAARSPWTVAGAAVWLLGYLGAGTATWLMLTTATWILSSDPQVTDAFPGYAAYVVGLTTALLLCIHALLREPLHLSSADKVASPESFRAGQAKFAWVSGMVATVLFLPVAMFAVEAQASAQYTTEGAGAFVGLLLWISLVTVIVAWREYPARKRTLSGWGPWMRMHASSLAAWVILMSLGTVVMLALFPQCGPPAQFDYYTCPSPYEGAMESFTSNLGEGFVMAFVLIWAFVGVIGRGILGLVYKALGQFLGLTHGTE